MALGHVAVPCVGGFIGQRLQRDRAVLCRRHGGGSAWSTMRRTTLWHETDDPMSPEVPLEADANGEWKPRVVDATRQFGMEVMHDRTPICI